MARRVSIDDVARMAGVSITTVSRVINKSPTVKKANRLKVEAAIQKLKFNPNIIAQRLASGKTNCIGLVIPRYEGIFYSFYALELIRGIGTMCDALKLDLLLHLAGGPQAFLNPASVGGAIFADIIANRKHLENLLAQGTPAIVINNHVKDLEVNCIAIDNLNGAVEAVKYLADLGHKRIAHIAGDLITQAAVQRQEGYIKVLKEKGLTVREDYIFKTDYSRQAARSGAEKLLSYPERPTAIFIASDNMAQEAINVIMEKGLKVPDDISVIGFDDNPMALYGPVALTTVRQPLVEMAQKSVVVLNDMMNGKHKKITREILPAKLVVRDSCKQI